MKNRNGSLLGRKLAAVACAVVMACALLLAGVAAKPAFAYDGDGTANSPYLVSTASDLVDALTRGGYTKLTGAITLNDEIQISGSSGHSAYLDLNGKKISMATTANADFAIKLSSNSSLTLRDGSTGGGGSVVGNKSCVEVGSSSALVMEGGTVSGSSGYGVKVGDGGSANLKGGAVTGTQGAVSGSVTNVKGISWTNATGTSGRQAIDASTSPHAIANSLKKVQFPAYDVTVDDGTADLSPALRGETVTVTANDPESGKAFDKWTTSSDGVTFTSDATTPTTFTMPGNAAAVTATYKDETTYEIAASADPSEGGEVSGAGTYTEGQTATLTATPAEGYVFVCWTENGQQVEDEGAQATYSFEVTGARTLVALFRRVIIATTISDQTYASKPIEPNVPATDVSLDGVDYSVQSTDYELSYENNVHAGTNTATVILTFSGKLTGTARKTFTIKPAPLTVKAGSATREYDGTALTADYSCSGLLGDDSIASVAVTGSQTDVGETASKVSDAVIKNSKYGDVTNDYTITYEPGKLKVTPYSKKVTVKVTGHSATYTYDGATHEVAGYDATPNVSFYTESDYTFTGNASVKASSVGTHSMGLSASNFSNKSANFSNVVFEVTDGTLTIKKATTKKATLYFDLAGGTLNGQTGTYTMTANVGSTVKLPKAPTRSGYTFKYWKGSQYAAGASYKVTETHTFTAVWEKNAQTKTYTVSFDANGGSGTMNKMAVQANTSVTLPANKYTRSGYTFAGWNTSRDGRGTAYKDQGTITPTGNLTLYAQWRKNTTSSNTNTTSTTKRQNDLATTGDATPLGLATLVAAGGLCLMFVGKRRQRSGR